MRLRSHQRPADSSEWWHDYFPAFRPFFAKIPAQTTQAEVRFIVKYLGLRPGMSFLDCPCGIGRIAVPLAKRGIKVTGVDVTRSYVDELTLTAAQERLPITAVRRDMRRITYHNQFDAGGNLWTSFGFFEREPDNLLVLRMMFRALKPGGKFLLHVVNRDWILRNYEPEGWFKVGPHRLFNRRRFDFATSVQHDRWLFIGPDGRQERVGMIRMYSPHELVAMFRRVGFTNIALYGGYRGEPLTQNRRMQFVIGTKPQ